MRERSLNLKNAETYGLATQVAQITGESMTQAVTTALRERLARLDQNGQKTRLAKDLMAIGADCAKRLSPKTKRLDHATLLYDEKGLPR